MKTNTVKKIESRKIALCAFFIVFIFELCLSLLIPAMRSLPDEMGAVALAAKATGYDWNYVLTHPAKYYGSGTFPLLVPFFFFIKNPMILYKCLLGVAAFLHAIPAYIACRMIQKYYKITDKPMMIVAIGILAALFTPTRASNIDNEPMLIFLCWIMVYLIVILQFEERDNKKIYYSVVLAFVLAISYLSHTRAVLYIVVAVMLIIVYKFFTKRWLVNIPAFSITLILSGAGAFFVSNVLKQILFTPNDYSVVNNTPEEVVSSAVDNAQSLLSLTGIRSFFDLLCSNTWIIFVFSGGIAIFCITLIFAKTVRNTKNIIHKECVNYTSIYFPMLFLCLGIVISILGLCITWLPQAMSVHTDATNLSRGHFYLRYYGNYFGPLILFFIVYLWNDKVTKKEKQRINIASLLILIVAGVFSVGSFLFITSIIHKYQYSLDWFYYFAPFSGMVNSWPNTIQTLSYFFAPTLVAIVVFVCVNQLFNRKNKATGIILLLAFFAWQYIYGVLRFDLPYANSENYYKAVDATYTLYEEDKSLFEDENTIYYYNQTYGPEYIVQFMLPDYKVITDISLVKDNDGGMVLSNVQLDANQFASSWYEYVQLDDNEYLYICNSEQKEKFRRKGFILQKV